MQKEKATADTDTDRELKGSTTDVDKEAERAKELNLKAAVMTTTVAGVERRVLLDDDIVHKKMLEACRGEKLITSSEVSDFFEFCVLFLEKFSANP